MVCTLEPCWGHSRELVSWHLLSPLTALWTPCLALVLFTRQNSHLTAKDHAKSAGCFQMVMTWWGHFVGYTWKLGKIWGDPTTSCLLFSTQVSCLLIAWGNYPPWYNPGLLESSLSQMTGALSTVHGSGILSFWTAIQFSSGNALTKDQSSNWRFMICPSAATLVRPYQPQKEATGWGMYSQTAIFILFSL